MTTALDKLDPAPLWREFATLTLIPRPPRQEDAALTYVRRWAAGHGLDVMPAGGRNLLVRVPATSGREGAPVVILQAHIDMVCEREPDSRYDPAQGRIRLLRDGDWLTADGTTLGADDGIGVAAMMAVAEDAAAAHGPLELLVTTAEELGLEGAGSVDGSVFKGRTLLNLDGQEDGTLVVGCAGSTDSFLRLAPNREPVTSREAALSATVGGGAGGHSGMDIALGRANAVKALNRCLREALVATPFRLASFNGGKSRNAIPRDASAVLVVSSGRAHATREALAGAATQVRDQFSGTDPDIGFTLASCETPGDAWSAAGTRRILDAVAAVPSGPLSMSPVFAGVVETSTSLGVATTEGARLDLRSLTRTSDQRALPDVLGALSGIARLADGDLEVTHGYPGWRPDPGSPLLATCRSVHTTAFGAQPRVTAMHAGLEPALLGERIPGLDMISMGPQLESPHSPRERVNISSVQRFWTFLAAVLDRLSV